MKEIARFKIGSRYFFENFDDYVLKDKDILVIMDNWKLTRTNVLNLKDKNGNDVFFYKDMNKDEFIKDTLESGVPMRCGKFLIKEFNEYIGFTIDDLKKLDEMFQKMDEKHIYEKYIYECFIKNDKFELNSEQLAKSFDIYKERELLLFSTSAPDIQAIS